MPRKLRPVVNFHERRFMQISESHCGPAVIQMLLSYVGIDVTQEAVAEAGGASSLIELNGMRVDQLGLAVRRLAPEVTFYYKEHSSLEDLVRAVNNYHYPVGVEWQGLFDDDEDDEADDEDDADEEEDEEDDEDSPETANSELLLPDAETEDSDYGHYSVVVRADRRRRKLIIADPYKDYFSQARIFDFNEFDHRWYDYNEITDPVSGQTVLVEDNHMMFVVVRRGVLFPRRLGMQVLSV